MNRCIDHLNFTNSICPDCGEPVDAYGNTDSQFEYCTFPDCGCDGARLCMAGEASPYALSNNIEGMWSGDSVEQVAARKAMVLREMGIDEPALSIIRVPAFDASTADDYIARMLATCTASQRRKYEELFPCGPTEGQKRSAYALLERTLRKNQGFQTIRQAKEDR